MADETRYVSEIQLPSENSLDFTNYEIRDKNAWEVINSLRDKVSAAVHYRGVVTEPALADGLKFLTKDYVKIQNSEEEYYPENGDIFIYTPFTEEGEKPAAKASREFIFKQTGEPGVGIFNEFGSTSALKSLAFADKVSGEITPKGTISGRQNGIPLDDFSTINLDINPFTVNILKENEKEVIELNPIFQGEETSIISKGSIFWEESDEPPGAVIIDDYIPSGTITNNFYAIKRSIDVSENENTIGYIPKGRIVPPTIQTTVPTTEIKVNTLDGQLPELVFTVEENKNLKIDFNPGAMPSFEEKEVMVPRDNSNQFSVNWGDEDFSFIGTMANLKTTAFTRLTANLSESDFDNENKATVSSSFVGENVPLNVKNNLDGFTVQVEGNITPKGEIGKIKTEMNGNNQPVEIFSSGLSFDQKVYNNNVTISPTGSVTLKFNGKPESFIAQGLLDSIETNSTEGE